MRNGDLAIMMRELMKRTPVVEKKTGLFALCGNARAWRALAQDE